MLTCEIALQLCQGIAKGQLHTSDTVCEGDTSVFGRGDKMTPHGPKSPTGAQKSYSECYHTGRSIFKHE